MSFIADKQTLEDLNLLGRYKQHSIFNLFNKVVTGGGEQLLQAMFLHPLSDPAAINTRSHTFRYFQQQALTFPFSKAAFSALENYMEGSSGNSYLAVFTTLGRKKVKQVTVRDEDYVVVETGLLQSMAILLQCKAFLEGLDINPHNPYAARLAEAKHMLTDKRFTDLLAHVPAVHWSFGKVVQYDYQLRYVLRTALQTVINVFHELDVYITVGNVAMAKGLGYAQAVTGEENVLEAKGLFHPAIDKAVANDITFERQHNLLFLTGANMAGKSTFMKAVGINLYLAHMGFPVAAASLLFSVKEGMYTSINVSDNLNQGYSHFYAEVLRVKNVAAAVGAGKKLLVIFDELFKGTNVKDAFDATLAVTAALTSYDDCCFIISTHIIEVGEVLREQSDKVQLQFLPTVMNGTRPAYTYVLETGISSDRHGMMILENEGVFELLTE